MHQLFIFIQQRLARMDVIPAGMLCRTFRRGGNNMAGQPAAAHFLVHVEKEAESIGGSQSYRFAVFLIFPVVQLGYCQ